MEIRTALYPLSLPPAPAQSGRPNAVQTQQTPAGPQPGSTTSSLTEYVNHGELLNGQGGGDYRDLIRAARQQQVQASNRHGIPSAGQTPYATRALSAYQSNAAVSGGTAPSTYVDETA